MHQIKNLKNIYFKKMSFLYSSKAFSPTGTSEILADEACKLVKNKKNNILDFGCGIGVVGIYIAKKKKNCNFFASDISSVGTKLTLINSKKHNVKIEVKKGDLFSPWKNYKFDYIINDVSGVSNKISKISPWFKNVSCQSGLDGTKLTIKILKNSKKFLKNKGKIFFPIISLSKKEKILNVAKKIFKNVKLLNSRSWPMPKEMYKHKSLLLKLKKRKIIDFKEKFGILTFDTEVYLAE
jgi:methylase of polypeptide subunit release factors